MSTPLVTIVCLCFNHERFVTEALDSVFNQSYKNLQVIVVDDASNDASQEIIEKYLKQRPHAQFFALKSNIGNCAAFNVALSHAEGKYIVDFSTDDVMPVNKISEQVSFFENLDESYGVVFTEASYIDVKGRKLREHFQSGRTLTKVPEGDVYKEVVAKYFIPSPTMMVRSQVLRELNGYDETLAYEDFDFWVRASRNYRFAFLNKNLMNIRVSEHSLSRSLYKKGDRQLYSTYLVCEKVLQLNRNEEENRALVTRVRYELRHAVFTENQPEAELFGKLLRRLKAFDALSSFLLLLGRMPHPLRRLRQWYIKLRY
jgi:glycosyltransferase involved in cell wall biosynthesis